MAKNNKKGASSGYVFAAILVAIIYVLNTVLVWNIYSNNMELNNMTSTANRAINQINGELSKVNTNAIGLGANLYDNPLEIVADTERIYANIETNERLFESLDLPESVMTRYEYAKSMIATFRIRLESLGTNQLESGDAATMTETLKQDLYPLQIPASEMLTSTINIVNAETNKLLRRNAMST